MPDFNLTTPVAFIIFKRADTTERVFQEIRRAKPPKLLVVADGPRLDRPGEAEQCAETRAIIDKVDWECEILKNYAETNMGCAKRLFSGLDWVFEQIEEAIILEDDCLPHPSFFRFCQELLDRYRDDDRIATITGQNVQFGRKRTDYSYYFSLHNRCWGWASWRRAWQLNDPDMKLWEEIKQTAFLHDILNDVQAVKYWSKIFQETYDGRIDTWDYQWTLACWLQNQLSVAPSINLISNIGFGGNATHSMNAQDSFARRFASMPTEPIQFPLKHPPFMIRDVQADAYMQKTFFNISFLDNIKMAAKKLFKDIL
jgi:hypothetical protein